MHPGAMARYRIDDMVAEAERYRRTAGVQATAWGSRKLARRRLGRAALSVLVWPFRR